MFIKRHVKAWEQIKNFHTLSKCEILKKKTKNNDAFLLCFIFLNIYAVVKINIEQKTHVSVLSWIIKIIKILQCFQVNKIN